MKKGICSKCNSPEIYHQEGNIHSPEIVTLKGKVFGKGVAPDKYICISCGYLEYYLPINEENAKLIRENWKRL